MWPLACCVSHWHYFLLFRQNYERAKWVVDDARGTYEWRFFSGEKKIGNAINELLWKFKHFLNISVIKINNETLKYYGRILRKILNLALLNKNLQREFVTIYFKIAISLNLFPSLQDLSGNLQQHVLARLILGSSIAQLCCVSQFSKFYLFEIILNCLETAS